jgi:2-polyprenyl-3-methyl-5-hydroxy-6-metoxy-1,4-benzoquinol methylase
MMVFITLSPDKKYDYIFSSHCLEHLPDWVGVLDYWTYHLKSDGCLFLYLPHYSQTYWRPWNNRKHVNILTPKYLHDYMEASDFKHIWTTGPDLNNAFYAVGIKR